jgi:Domain of unknown function (DUF4340)
MSARVFVSLLVITVLAVVAAGMVAVERPTAAPVRYVDEPAFPALRANPDAVAKVVLTTPDGSFTLVRETGDHWSALERYGYPVDSNKVRALIVALADMRLIEAKTSMPERYTRLEVEDLDAKDAKSRLLRVESADGTVLAEAILGKRQHRLTGAQAAGTYLRRPGEAQSWLASGGTDLDTEVVDWLDADIIDLDPARIARIEITPDSGPSYAAQRADAGGPLQLADLGADEKAKPDADLNRLAGAFAQLKLQDVKPRGEVDWPETDHGATAATFDGVEVTMHLAKIDGEPWAMLDARAVETAAPAAPAEAAPEAAAEGESGSGQGTEQVDITPKESKAPPASADELETRLQPWAFKISSQVFDRLTKPRSEWLEDSGTS